MNGILVNIFKYIRYSKVNDEFRKVAFTRA